MNIWKISIQNMRSKPMYTFLSVLMLALSIALLLSIQQLKSSFKYQMENNLGPIDMVVGAKGSPLQLVLSSVLHIDNPTGNISYKEAKKISKNPMIEKAVPISYGDNYKGYRIVGTTTDFLKFYNAELESGRAVHKSMEVVLGHHVATQLQLSIGDTFLSSHGLVSNTVDVHDQEFVVIGILKPTQKVIDRLILTNLESVWEVHDHDEEVQHEHIENEDSHEHHDEGIAHHHDEQVELHDNKEITSLLVSFRSPMGLLTLPRTINTNTNLQAALPKFELDRLYQFTGIGFKTISWIAYIILVISGLTIFVSLYKMVKERAFELALFRTYGANHVQLIKIITFEGLLVVMIAVVLGFLMANACLLLISNMMESSFQSLIIQELAIKEVTQIIGLVFVMVIISIALAIHPILKMNISTILSNEK